MLFTSWSMAGQWRRMRRGDAQAADARRVLDTAFLAFHHTSVFGFAVNKLRHQRWRDSQHPVAAACEEGSLVETGGSDGGGDAYF